MGIAEASLIYESLRTLALIALPLMLAVSLAGLLVAALQSSTNLQDPASAFSIRLLALVAALLLLGPAFGRMILDLAGAALQ